MGQVASTSSLETLYCLGIVFTPTPNFLSSGTVSQKKMPGQDCYYPHVIDCVSEYVFPIWRPSSIQHALAIRRLLSNINQKIILSVLFCGALAGNYGGYANGGYGGYGGYGGHGYGHGHRGYGYGGLYQKVVSHHGNTKFAYNDGVSTRQEHIAYDGSAYGSYSVQGADGKLRTVNYKAGKDGFQIIGDDGSPKEDNVARAAALAEVAAELAKAAPVAPEVPDVPDVPVVAEADLPVAPTNAPDYGKRNEDVYANRKKYYGAKHHYGGYGHGGYGGYGGYGHGVYGNGGYGYGAGYGHGYGGNRGYGYGYAPASYGYSVGYAPGYGYGKGYGHGKWKEESKEIELGGKPMAIYHKIVGWGCIEILSP
ncbi:hypothetical protein GQR58_005592 [Nymphon striatum]|nr:hypothetical protein GQR58_005592 [Nymphon striatum]